MKGKVLIITLVTLMCASCYVRTVGRKTLTQDDLGLMLDAYPVERGIGDRYSPCELVICAEDAWVLSAWDVAESCNAFFLSKNKGVDWDIQSSLGRGWSCENMLTDGGVIYCSARDQGRTGGITDKAGKIFSSADYGKSWKELCAFDAEIERLLVVGSTIAVQLYAVAEKDGEGSYETSHSILVSNDLGGSWREYAFGDFYVSSFSNDIITVAVSGNVEAVLELDPERQEIDTIQTDAKMIANVVRGDDVIGLADGGNADYFRITDGVANYCSRIQYEGAFVNHIPTRIYQCDSIVYTMVAVPGANSTSRMFASTDRGKSWAEVSTESKLDLQLDSVWTPEGDVWFMAGYKDRMVSYCVGYKDGRRRDFIKKVTVCH